MYPRNVSTLYPSAVNVTTNTVGSSFNTQDYQNIVFQITATNATIKFQGTITNPANDGSLALINFANAASATNQWGFINVKNYLDDSTIVGGTGLVATTAQTYIVEMNTNGLSWVNIQITGNTGSVTAYVKGYSTQ